ncbi:MAG: hypothetical protein HOK67_17990 [Deltaproteobacteria bacterium]|nr:hypothetical protein [Deltaproteobacteria bacterium]
MRIKKISYAGAFLKEADPVKGLLQDILGLPVTYDKVNPETVHSCVPVVGDNEVERVTDTVEEGPISKMMKYCNYSPFSPNTPMKPSHWCLREVKW